MPCLHLRTIGDNYGVTCADCGEPLKGFGFFAEGSQHCVSHLWMQDGANGFVCLYCEEWRPADENGEVIDVEE